ncbi:MULTISPECIES: CPBP family intramembrane glutamic endopeptidase [Haloferax]|uniref:CPBP family intramembrane glutamic endopeptidase n=1 Tax=Haloferax TaxID=2251 RepID=UPI000B7E7067|nr:MULTISPECIES: CPBP family intramembrane glutamic endopeptidase [Haloferax]MDS0242620.1 CPBP family intramembrane metalloprotease [Haloferax sp. S2CR25]MDS0445741.1 CPBP family intramembrane metalloprotease [Haloferax sp. S2CR25-2]
MTEAVEPLAVSPRRLLWNDTERRPRAPFRLLATPVVFVVVSLVVGLSLSTALGGLAESSRLVSLVVSLVSVGASGLAALVVARYVDRRTIADLGLGFDREWAVDLAFGLALGTGLMTAVFVVGVAADWISVSPAPLGVDRLLGVGSLLAFFVVVGIAEELLLRGIVLTDVAEGLRWRFDPDVAVAGGLAVSSAVFGVAHYTNPNAGFASTTSITLAGVMLGLGYALTGDLAIPTGIHISWNFVQGGVFGFAVSGLDFGTSLVETTERGPDVITGGAFGPEAGLLGVGAIVLGAVCIAAYVRARRGDLGFDPSVTVPDLRWKQ